MEDLTARANIAGQVKVWADLQSWARLKLTDIPKYGDPRAYEEVLAMARDQLMLLQPGRPPTDVLAELPESGPGAPQPT